MDLLNVVIWLVLGGLMGLIVAVIARSNRAEHTFMDLIVGVIAGGIGGALAWVLQLNPEAIILDTVHWPHAIAAALIALVALIMAEGLYRTTQS